MQELMQTWFQAQAGAASANHQTAYSQTPYGDSKPPRTGTAHFATDAQAHNLPGMKIGVFHDMGSAVITIDLGLRRSIKWIFCIAEVLYAIIGTDLLSHHGIIVNLADHLIVDGAIDVKSSGTHCNASICGITGVPKDSSIANLLTQFPQITGQASNQRTKAANVYGQGEWTATKTSARQTTSRTRRIPTHAETKICRPSSSPWASPLHLRKKNSGHWRPCGN